jgi:hypothetical protein
MTEAAHRKRHEELHAALDELIADWISHSLACSTRLPSKSTILDLMTWSHQQTLNPTPLGGLHDGLHELPEEN